MQSSIAAKHTLSLSDMKNASMISTYVWRVVLSDGLHGSVAIEEFVELEEGELVRESDELIELEERDLMRAIDDDFIFVDHPGHLSTNLPYDHGGTAGKLKKKRLGWDCLKAAPFFSRLITPNDVVL